MRLVLETELTSCRKHLFAVSVLLLLILITYSNTFHAGWHFDDTHNILNRKAVHLERLAWPDIKRSFFDDDGKLYRPVAGLSFAFNHRFGRTDVFGYHLVNLAVHFLAAVFLYLLLSNTLRLPRLKAEYGPDSYFVALLATVLWAVNPVQTQAVTYIVQRMAGLAGLFSVMTLYFYLKARTARAWPAGTGLFTLAMLSALLAFGSKENAALLPLAVLLFDLLLIQGLSRRSLIRAAALAAALLAVPLLLALLLKGPGVLDPARLLEVYGGYREFGLYERLLTQFRVLVFYLTLLLYPMPDRLNILHDFGVSRGLFEPVTTILAVLAVLGLIGLALLRARKNPLPAYCILFFFLQHLIESSVLPLELVFEHRNYLPSMLLFVPPALLASRALAFFRPKPAMRAIVASFVVLFLVALGHGTFVRNMIWRTEESLWLDALDKSPRLPRVHHNLGRYYADIGQKDLAMAEYRQALDLPRGPNAPTNHASHYNLGLIYESLGRPEEAERHFLKTIEIAPGFAPAYTMLGLLEIRAGRSREAFERFIQALTRDPEDAKAHNNLGFILLKQRRLPEAVHEFQETLRLKPGDPDALTNLALAYRHLGRLEESLAFLRQVLEADPRSLTTLLRIVEVGVLHGRGDAACDTARELLEKASLKELALLLDWIAGPQNPTLELPDVNLVAPVLREMLAEKSFAYQALAARLPLSSSGRP